jgi:hypothetical protein
MLDGRVPAGERERVHQSVVPVSLELSRACVTFIRSKDTSLALAVNNGIIYEASELEGTINIHLGALATSVAV